MEVLLQKYGIEPRQVDRVVLAGGFGYYLNPRAAARIGLLPRLLAEKAFPGGEPVATPNIGIVASTDILAADHFESHYLQRMNFY